MNKKNMIPQQTKPVVRVTQGTQANLLAELSEEVLGTTTGTSASWINCMYEWNCAYDGDDAE